MIKANILGASGYIGGELIRLLLTHPEVQLNKVTSDSLNGRFVQTAHPNLRGHHLKFSSHSELDDCDVLFMATKHGVASRTRKRWQSLAPLVIDLSADFRLKDPLAYQHRYGATHEAPDLLPQFTPGIPEIHRETLRSASHIAVPGCMANAAILALWPLARAGLLGSTVYIDGKSGSSGSGSVPGPATHHPERSGVTRTFKPTGHRHEAEIAQVCGTVVRMTAASVEAVRGVHVTGYSELRRPVSESHISSLYRVAYGNSPFVRLVNRRSGAYGLPEPKLLTGTNFCDVGFGLADDGRGIACFSALDNLVKGGAGNAVECMNIRMGWKETAGLEFTGLHPL